MVVFEGYRLVLSSFYNVDRTIKNAKLLDTAKRVMEVDVNNNEYTQNSLKKNNNVV